MYKASSQEEVEMANSVYKQRADGRIRERVRSE